MSVEVLTKDRRTIGPFMFSTWLLVVFIMVGILLTITHIDYPIVRNSLIYAGIVDAISEYGLLSEGLSEQAHEKSLGFSILAWPLVQLMGLSTGLKTLSVLTTALWGFACLNLFRRVAGHSEEIVCLGLVLTLFNPLAIYQFSSAYPDTLLAALILFGLTYMDRVLSEDARTGDGLVWVAALIGAIWIKHHGFVLIAFAVVFLFLRHRVVARQWRENRPLFWSWVLPLAFALGVILLARQGQVPTFNLARDHNSFLRGFSLYQVVREGLQGWLAYMLLTFSVLLALPLVTPFWRHIRSIKPDWFLAATIFVVTLLVYNGTGYNMRYFLAIAPFFAWTISILFFDLSRAGKILWLSVFLAFNLGTTLFYNVPSFHRLVYKYAPLPFVDNLRLTAQQFAEQNNLRLIRRHAASHDNTVIFLSRYYGDGSFGVWQKTGDLSAGLNIHYAKYWKHEMIEQLGLKRAVIYEYVATGPERNYLWLDTEIQQNLTKLNNRIYLLDLDHMAGGSGQ
ncbi:MAG: hypothetical protein HN725_11900 [Alphaproteobacteria bacterium]|jgi:hypothetical protein|nr:hypothetical protein [Alphaproteobacteria bacterium]MBT4086793.1 hypothetical protein [Alphaproteobacteria bacterium]MBT4542456.1 hypothetical protein [Alphaproteobacteria bacterium]MBT7745986.1 hypothetical protein [Alphaproteobacteria bacterium]